MHADLFTLKSVYLNSAYFGPTPKRAKELIDLSLKRSMDPAFLGFDEWFKLTEQNRVRLARLIGTAPDAVALSTSVSELVGHVSNGMELHPQDEILLLEGDFPSMILPWMVVAELKGLRLNFLKLEEFMDPARFKKHLNGRTRLAACSHVLFDSGIQLPIAELAAHTKKAEVLFLADISQSFGGMRITPEILKNVDILVGVAYKWLLGPYGSAIGWFSERAQKEIRRTHASWQVSPNSVSAESLLDYTTEALPGARKFDRGQSSSPLINAGLQGAFETLEEAGLEKIERHNHKLTAHFLSNLPAGFTPKASKDHLSNIVCIHPAEGNALELKSILAENGVDVSVREGNLRLSFHLFNTVEQVDKVLKLLAAAGAA